MTHIKVRMSPQARAWYLAEIAYMAERNPIAAEKMVARMRASLQTLSDHPKIASPGLIPGTRRFIITPYILTIRQRDEMVEIIAIRHARQSDADDVRHTAVEDEMAD